MDVWANNSPTTRLIKRISVSFKSSFYMVEDHNCNIFIGNYTFFPGNYNYRNHQKWPEKPCNFFCYVKFSCIELLLITLSLFSLQKPPLLLNPRGFHSSFSILHKIAATYVAPIPYTIPHNYNTTNYRGGGTV